jgi:hypothetical protein
MNQTDPNRPSYTPVIVDLGRQSRKEIRRLKNHQPGKLMDEINNAVSGVIREFGPAAKDKEIVPVVILYRQKRRRRGGGGGLPFPLPLPFRF